MELEHFLQMTTGFAVLQMVFTASLYTIEQMGRVDMVRSFVRSLASWVVTLGPAGLLVYVLVEVSKLR